MENDFLSSDEGKTQVKSFLTIESPEMFVNTNHISSNNDKKQITLMSFGWKHGPPPNAVHNFNLKRLPNPSISIRKRKTGLDKELQQEFFEDR